MIEESAPIRMKAWPKVYPQRVHSLNQSLGHIVVVQCSLHANDKNKRALMMDYAKRPHVVLRTTKVHRLY